MTSSKLNLLV